jgi:hypothetical protein
MPTRWLRSGPVKGEEKEKTSVKGQLRAESFENNTDVLNGNNWL